MVVVPEPSVFRPVLGRPVTPRLQSLRIGHIGAARVRDNVSLYCAPTLRVLSVDMHASLSPAQDTFMDLLQVCTDLVDLSMTDFILDGPNAQILLVRLPLLRRLRCSYMTLEAISTLSTFEQLDFLAFGCSIPSGTNVSPSPYCFPRLLALEMQFHNPSDPLVYLSDARLPDLREFTLDSSQNISTFDLATVTSMLLICSSLVICRLTISRCTHQHMLRLFRPSILNARHFSGVISSRQIVVLSLGLPFMQCDLHDHDIYSLASHCPHLSEFRLGGYGWMNSSNLTLRSLAYLVDCCPDLQILSLVIDASQNDVVQSIPRPSKPSLLTAINLGNSRISKRTSPVAHVLLRLFPSLASIETPWIGFHHPQCHARLPRSMSLTAHRSWGNRWAYVGAELSTFRSCAQHLPSEDWSLGPHAWTVLESWACSRPFPHLRMLSFTPFLP